MKASVQLQHSSACDRLVQRRRCDLSCKSTCRRQLHLHSRDYAGVRKLAKAGASLARSAPMATRTLGDNVRPNSDESERRPACRDPAISEQNVTRNECTRIQIQSYTPGGQLLLDMSMRSTGVLSIGGLRGNRVLALHVNFCAPKSRMDDI